MSEQGKLELGVCVEVSRKYQHLKQLHDIAQRRLDLEALKFEHRILTHRSWHMEFPWLAVQRDAGDMRDIGTLMAQECRYLEETGRTFEAKTERAAVEGLIAQLKAKGTL